MGYCNEQYSNNTCIFYNYCIWIIAYFFRAENNTIKQLIVYSSVFKLVRWIKNVCTKRCTDLPIKNGS